MLIIEKLPTRYSEGSATVVANEVTVTPTDALWYGNVWGDDLFFDPAQPLVPPQRIASVNEDGTLTLAYPWPGDTMTEAPYEVRYIGIIERSTAQTRRVIEELGKISPYYDVQVDTLADRDDYDDRPTGFAVLVADTGDGRAAIYSKNSATSGDWSDPAYVTGPAVTLGVGSVTPVAFGNDPDVTLNPVAGGYEFDFELPENATFQSGTITTLDPGEDATFSLSPVAGGYALNLGVPRGPTGDIDGVTPFWQGRITVDADAAAARAGLGATTLGSTLFTAASEGVARAALGVDASAPVSLTSSDDINSVPDGWYRWTIGANKPANAPFDYGIMIQKHDGGQKSQFVFGNNTFSMTASRRFSGGTPDPWSYSGAQYGSNANGDFVRYADGTQICYCLGSLVWANNNFLDLTWSFPASFAAAPIVVWTCGDFSNSAITGPAGGLQNVQSVGSSSATVRQYRITGGPNFQSGDTIPAYLCAVGRWF